MRKVATTRKLTPQILPSSGKLQLTDPLQVTSGRRHNGVTFKNGHSLKIDDKNAFKRTKRTLTLENKEKTLNPRSVKVLRRSHIVSRGLKEETCERQPVNKFCLPSVNLIKSI